MKKFIAVFLIYIFCVCPFSTGNALAVENRVYSRALTYTTGFYSDMNGAYLKFYVPYGYYVKVLERGDDYSKVSYMPENASFPILIGYVKTVDLIISETPSSPYPLLYVSVISDEVLFADSSLAFSKAAVYSGSLALYYGELLSPADEELVYVYCNGYLGYMRKNAFAPFNVPENPEPLPSSSQNSYSEKKNSSSSLQILIVALISIAVAVIVYVLFRPSSEREEFED